MSATSIGWTDLTLNPVIGCSHAAYQQEDGRKVAHPGCMNCYAELLQVMRSPEVIDELTPFGEGEG